MNCKCDQCDNDNHVIEKGFGPKSFVVAVIPVKSHDSKDLQYTILNDDLVTINVVFTFKI